MALRGLLLMVERAQEGRTEQRGGGGGGGGGGCRTKTGRCAGQVKLMCSAAVQTQEVLYYRKIGSVSEVFCWRLLRDLLDNSIVESVLEFTNKCNIQVDDSVIPQYMKSVCLKATYPV